MIINNPEHKKAVFRKVGNYLKSALCVTIAGVIITVSVFIYDTFLRKHKVELETDLGNLISEDATAIDIAKDKIGLKRKIAGDFQIAEAKHTSIAEENIYIDTPKKTDSLSNQYKETILWSIGKNVDDIKNYELTKEDYDSVKKLDGIYALRVYNDSDLEWLNKCSNLCSLELQIESRYALDNLKKLKSLPIETIKISMANRGSETKIDIDEKYFPFLEICPKLSRIFIDSEAFKIDSKYLSNIAAKSQFMSLFLEEFGYATGPFDVEKLKNYQSVNIIPSCGDASYDMPIVLSREDFKNLCNLNLTIEGVREDGMLAYQDKVMNVYNQIDDIAKSIPIHDNMTDEEKIKKVLKYVLDNVSYNKIISDYIKSGEAKGDFLENVADYVIAEHDYSYLDGMLYGVLAEEGKAICGNYAALMNVLLNHFGVESYALHSDSHAYNLVSLNNEYYILDATVLDGDIVDFDNIIDCKLHLKPTNVPNEIYNTLYSPVNIPESNADSLKRADEIVSGLKEKYQVRINNEIYTVSAFVLISLLLGLGLAKVKKKTKSVDYECKLNNMTKEELLEEQARLKEIDRQYKEYLNAISPLERVSERLTHPEEYRRRKQIEAIYQKLGEQLADSEGLMRYKK